MDSLIKKLFNKQFSFFWPISETCFVRLEWCSQKVPMPTPTQHFPSILVLEGRKSKEPLHQPNGANPSPPGIGQVTLKHQSYSWLHPKSNPELLTQESESWHQGWWYRVGCYMCLMKGRTLHLRNRKNSSGSGEWMIKDVMGIVFTTSHRETAFWNFLLVLEYSD